MQNKTQSPVLEVSLGTIAENYRNLSRIAGGATCAAVVKADAYGFGAKPISSALYDAGCRDFFVASVQEGTSLRGSLDKSAKIYLLNGIISEFEAAEAASNFLTPVLNNMGSIEIWAQQARNTDYKSTVIQIDTGMNRLGLKPDQIDSALSIIKKNSLDLELVMSHLSDSENSDSPRNREQKLVFDEARSKINSGSLNPKFSLAASSGLFIGPEFHYDIVRCGCGIYGSAPFAKDCSNILPAYKLTAPIIQVTRVLEGEAVGYSSGWIAQRDSTILTVSMGYADCLPRNLAGWQVRLDDHADEPRFGIVVGRVSMDVLNVDITDCNLPLDAIKLGTDVVLASGIPGCTLDDMADHSGVIFEEITTRLGPRVVRQYSYNAKGL